MLNFFKSVFKKKQEEAPKPLKFRLLLRKLINLSLDKEKLKSNFPEDKKEELIKRLEEGLQALNGSNTLTRAKQKKVNKVKIINLFKLIVIYGDNLETTKSDVIKK